MAKKTRKQLIEQVQALCKDVHQVMLPAEQLEEGLDCSYDLGDDLASVLYECLDERQATEVVRLVNLQDEVDCWELDGKKGAAQVWLYDRAALLKLLDKLLQDTLGRFSYVAVMNDELVLCNRLKRTNVALNDLIEQLTEDHNHALQQEREKDASTRLAKCSKELDRVIKKVGADKAYSVVEAALKQVK